MAETVKTGDFVELEYTGLLKDSKVVFDTTIEAVAKKEGIFETKMAYGPVSICIGQGQILSGLDAHIDGLEIGKEKEITLPPEQAFGKKDAKLMKLVPTGVFRKQGINPVVGLQINIDGMVGVIRTVTGGRTIVDFNHPLASKEVLYKVVVKRKITDEKEKVLALVELALNQKKEAIKIDIKEQKAIIEVKHEFPKELLELVKQRILTVLPEIKDVEWKVEKKQEKKEEKKETTAPKAN